MATIDLITYDQKMVTPKDDALIHQFGISNGVLYGCEVTLANSNTLHITGGQGVIYGRQWEIAEGDITVTLPASGSLKGRLYVKIDLSNTTNPIELLVQTAVTLPDLTDDDQINVDNSVSELEICTFDVSSLTISNLERTVEQVADGDHQDVVDLQADVSEIKSNLTELGTPLTASWIAKTLSAQDIIATNSITLTAGKYIINTRNPICSNESGYFSVKDSNNNIIDKGYCKTTTYGINSFILDVSETISIYIISATSSISVTTSSVDRAEFRAVKIG